MPVGVITTRYAAQQEILKAVAATIASEALGLSPRSWHVPDLNGWLGNPHDLAGVSLAFDRTQPGTIYAEALSGPNGSEGDAMSLKIQSDYLAAQERAWRARHMSPIRATLHAGARRTGHAMAQVGVFDRVTQYAADLLTAGAAGWVAPRQQ